MDNEQGIERKGIDEHELQAVKYQLKKGKRWPNYYEKNFTR